MKSIGVGYSQTKAFSYLSVVSNEKEKQLKIIQENIKDIKKNSFLDVGAGAGDIFIPLTKEFKESVGVEPGEKMFDVLKKRSEKDKNIKLYKKTWQNYFKTNNKKKFDLIILVHAIYFFEDVKKEIENLISLLNKKGKLIIVCGSGKKVEKREFNTRFTTYFRHKFLGADLNKKSYFDIPVWFPEMKCKRFKCFLKLRNLKYLDKDHLSKESEATNNFFKFIFKRWWDEYTVNEKKELNEYLKRYLTKDKEYYIVPNYDQRMYVYKK